MRNVAQMSGEGQTAHAPRHLAPSGRRGFHRRAPGEVGAAAHLKPMAALALEAEEAAEVSPLTRVQRGRAAIALSVTLAAMPVLVLDNLPANAQTSDGALAAVATIVEESSSTLGDGPSTTSTTVPPTTST